LKDKTALVLKRFVPAATLTNIDGTVSFSYLPEYLGSDGPAIASSLPKDPNPRVFNNGASPAYFSGLLPEGRRLNAIAKTLKTSASNDLELLLALGADAIGDVQVIDPQADPYVSSAIELPRDSSSLSFTELQEQYFGSAASGLPGFQDKISSRMLNAPARHRGKEFIIKFNSDQAPHAVENEFFFLTLANRVGLQTAGFELLTDRDGHHALQLERFDRLVLDGKTTRLAMEDACQVLDLYPSQKYEVEFETAATALIRLCSAPAVAALTLVKQLAFSYLIGNGDAHAKNFSVLQEPSGEWRVSPAYDLLCTSYYEDKKLALSVAGKHSGLSRKDLLGFAESLGLPHRLTSKVIDDLLRKLAGFTDELDSGILPFRRDQNYDATKLLRSRAKAFAG
jgi:serine/threonine-protein kinase HipA